MILEALIPAIIANCQGAVHFQKSKAGLWRFVIGIVRIEFDSGIERVMTAVGCLAAELNDRSFAA